MDSVVNTLYYNYSPLCMYDVCVCVGVKIRFGMISSTVPKCRLNAHNLTNTYRELPNLLEISRRVKLFLLTVSN